MTAQSIETIATEATAPQHGAELIVPLNRLVVSGDVEATLRDSEFGLLSDDAERRDASVAELFKECDIPPADRPELAAAIFAEVVPDRRIQVARTVKDRSVRLYLDRLTDPTGQIARSRPDMAPRVRLDRIARRVPEVMVKITGRTRDGGHLQNHLAYIGRNGKLPLEGPDGERLQSRAEVGRLVGDWMAEVEADPRRRKDSAVSLSIVLSMPPGTDPFRMHDASRAFAGQMFGDSHPYVFAFHADERHPHVHLTVRTLGHDGHKLNPRKADLEQWRQAFAAALRDRGVEAEATPRRTRGVVRKAEPEDDPALLTAVMSALASGDWDADAQAELEAVRARLEGRPVGDEVGPARLEAARLSGDWAEAEADFEAAMTAEAPAFTVISYASALSASGRWSVLDRHRIALLAFGTAGAVRIAATAAYNSGDATGALTILSDHASLFPGSRLPFGLRRIEAEALAQLGDHQQAVSRAAALAADSQTVADGLREARLRLNLGDLDGALPRVRAALDAGALDPEEALVWSQTFAGEQLDLARDLWRHAVSRELDDQTALKAYGSGFGELRRTAKRKRAS